MVGFRLCSKEQLRVSIYLHGDQLVSTTLKTVNDGTNETTLDSIRLDENESSLVLVALGLDVHGKVLNKRPESGGSGGGVHRWDGGLHDVRDGKKAFLAPAQLSGEKTKFFELSSLRNDKKRTKDCSSCS